MFIAIILYIIILFGIGIFDFFKVKNFEDYAVAGKNQSFHRVFLSLMATMIGASATIGIVDRTVLIGFPAFWWLAVGSMGLILQAVLLSEKIRNLDADTLPDVAEKTVGPMGRILLAIIISISWIGVIAAQFVSIVKIVSVVVPDASKNIILVIISLIVIVYTLFGGQISVIKTDSIQAIIIALGIIITFIYIFTTGSENNGEIFGSMNLINDSFSGMDLFNLIFITGGAYFLGPDIVSRNLVSKDGKTAKKAAIVSAIVLAVFSVIITLIGMWAIYNIDKDVMNGQNPLLYIMDRYVPYPLAILLCIALLSTLLSSVDTCIINAASIVEHDLLKRNKVGEVRAIVGVLGVAGLLIAMYKTDIISLLMSSYSIYVPGIVCPLFFAIWFHKKRTVCRPIWCIAVMAGGILGFLNSVFAIGSQYLPLIGMGVSLVISGISVIMGKKAEKER